MDLREYSKFANSTFRYCPPKCFELSGKSFELQMDDGYDLVISFADTTLEWNYLAKEPTAPQQETYECRKIDDTTYFVSYNLHDVTPKQNNVLVIDLEQMLVTIMIAKIGTNPRWPYLITTEFVFGAIKQEGVPYQHYPRHCFTDDVTGNLVKWQYSPSMATVHCYHDPKWYRITYPRDAREQQSSGTNVVREAMKKLPSSDEPADYIKIKDGIYLISITEQNMEKLLGAEVGFRSDNMCFLDNFKTCMNVGRGFGTITNADGEDRGVFLFLGAYGRIVDEDENEAYKQMMHDPIPFTV